MVELRAGVWEWKLGRGSWARIGPVVAFTPGLGVGLRYLKDEGALLLGVF